MRATTDKVAYLHFTVFDTDGITPLTGQAASCTSYLSYNGTAGSEAVTIAEIGSSGHYAAYFTPTASGSFHLSITCPDDRVQGDHFEVEDADLDSLDTKVTFIYDIEGGRWIIDEATNKQKFYKADGSTEVAIFSMENIDGNPASDDVYERTRDS